MSLMIVCLVNYFKSILFNLRHSIDAKSKKSCHYIQLLDINKLNATPLSEQNEKELILLCGIYLIKDFAIYKRTVDNTQLSYAYI